MSGERRVASGEGHAASPGLVTPSRSAAPFDCVPPRAHPQPCPQRPPHRLAAPQAKKAAAEKAAAEKAAAEKAAAERVRR